MMPLLIGRVQRLAQDQDDRPARGPTGSDGGCLSAANVLAARDDYDSVPRKSLLPSESRRASTCQQLPREHPRWSDDWRTPCARCSRWSHASAVGSPVATEIGSRRAAPLGSLLHWPRRPATYLAR